MNTIRHSYIQEKSAFPTEPHFAALVFDTITIPGDERSRTHPGHGYPESRKSVIEYIHFKDRTAMERWVRREQESEYGKPYTIIEVKPLSVKTSVSVEVS